MTIRPYKLTDADALLRLFGKHVPHAFGENEVADYRHFLQTNTDPYFVAEHDGQVVGACGHYVRIGADSPDGQTARIGWIFTDTNAKDLGVGSALVRYNLSVIDGYSNVRLIECRTSQVAYRFFEKFGFRLQHTEPDFWAPGLDLYLMAVNKKDLTSFRNL